MSLTKLQTYSGEFSVSEEEALKREEINEAAEEAQHFPGKPKPLLPEGHFKTELHKIEELEDELNRLKPPSSIV